MSKRGDGALGSTDDPKEEERQKQLRESFRTLTELGTYEHLRNFRSTE